MRSGSQPVLQGEPTPDELVLVPSEVPERRHDAHGILAINNRRTLHEPARCISASAASSPRRERPLSVSTTTTLSPQRHLGLRRPPLVLQPTLGDLKLKPSLEAHSAATSDEEPATLPATAAEGTAAVTVATPPGWRGATKSGLRVGVEQAAGDRPVHECGPVAWKKGLVVSQ